MQPPALTTSAALPLTPSDLRNPAKKVFAAPTVAPANASAVRADLAPDAQASAVQSSCIFLRLSLSTCPADMLPELDNTTVVQVAGQTDKVALRKRYESTFKLSCVQSVIVRNKQTIRLCLSLSMSQTFSRPRAFGRAFATNRPRRLSIGYLWKRQSVRHAAICCIAFNLASWLQSLHFHTSIKSPDQLYSAFSPYG